MPDRVVRKKQGSAGESEIFSIVIPTWNNLAYLALCIKSLRQNSDFRHQIIVHVNEGADGTLEWLEQQPDIDFSHTVENVGVCYALNICRSLVTTDYIVYMNDDMYACPGWDSALLQEVEAVGHKSFFISATAIEPTTSSACMIEKDFGTDIATFRETALLETFSSLQKSDWQGATWPPNIIHRDTWDLVGGYSIEFTPGMYSDPDFSMKLWKAGVRLFKGVAKSRVYHFGSKSTSRVKKNKGYYAFISKWGMTSSTVTKKYLRRGEPFDGPLTEPVIGKTLRLKNVWKRLTASFRNDNY
jgi:glycosyltransferase involved in cell wall biosynthesis